MEVIFSESDIHLFADASHDKNPLHCDYNYARKSPYGEQVVHGILGVLPCFEKFFQEKNAVMITALEISFLKPLFININYYVVIDKITNTFSDISIFDGETKHLRLCIEFNSSTELETIVAPPPHLYMTFQ